MATAEIEELLAGVDRPFWQTWQVKLLVLFAVLAGAGAVAYSQLSGEGSTATETQTATVQRGPVVTNVSLAGTMAAQSTAELAFDEPGVVSSVNVGIGQEVKAGDVLAEVESRAAQDAVAQAELNLQSAQIKLNQLLEGPSAADLASADQSVIQAEATLAEARDQLKTLRAGPEQSQILAAELAVKQAENQLEQAEASLDVLEAGNPLASEIGAAEAAVEAAELAVQQAKSELTELRSPPDASDIAAAEDAIKAAQAGVDAAVAKRDELLTGASQADIDQQYTQIQLLQLTLEAAQEDLEGTRIVAPFDGTVADLGIQPGDMVDATTAAMTLNTPDTLYIELTVSDSDYADLKVGQKGFATVESIDGASFPVEIVSIGTLPSTEQGVVTYQAIAHILSLDEVVQSGPQPGASADETAPTGRAPESEQSSAQERLPGGLLSGAENRASPLPGMQASVTLIVEQHLDVLTVPSGAVQNSPTGSTVQVLNPDGTEETVTVQTGLSNGRVTEIIEGLEEGETIVLPTQSSSGSSQNSGNLPGDNITRIGPGDGGGGIFVLPGGGAP